MTELHFERLTKLANHLLHGKLGHKVFDFGNFNTFEEEMPEQPLNICGTAGCAIGECPIVFPDDWEFDFDGSPGLKSPGCSGSLCGANSFFGLSALEVNLVFLPVAYWDAEMPAWLDTLRNLQDPPVGLPVTATKEQVGENILKFIKLKRNGTI